MDDIFSSHLIGQVSKSSPTPLYHQLYSLLKARILDGTLALGLRLPPEEQLADLFKVSRITAKRAMDDLATEELVERRRGRGTHVIYQYSPKPVQAPLTGMLQEIESMARNSSAQILDYGMRAPPQAIREDLRLADGETALHLLRVRERDGMKFGHYNSWTAGVDMPADPAIFEIESRGLFASSWQFAGHVSQLQRPGDYFTFEMAGESLFCVMDRDGAINAFYNVCQHRAHQLVQGSGRANVLTCPYHAWSYDLGGQLRAGPNIKAVEGFRREDICLTKVPIENFCGFLFVNLDPDARPMDEWFPGVRSELAAHVPQIEQLRPLEWVEIPETCNWKVSVENYSECYHCTLNHETFATGIVRPETYDIQPQGHCLRHTTECQNLDAMSYPIDLSANDYAGVYSSWFLWPMFSFQVYPGNLLNTYHWRAVDADHVIVWRGWYSIDGVESETVRQLAVQDRETTVEEDIHLVESVQRGLKSRGYRPGPLVMDPACGVNAEDSIAVLQAWMRDAADRMGTTAAG